MKCLEIVEQRKKGKFGLIRTNKGDAASKIHEGLETSKLNIQ